MKKWQIDYAYGEIDKAILSLNNIRTNLINIELNILRDGDETKEAEIREVPE